MDRILKTLIILLASFNGQVALANELEWTFVGAKSRGSGLSCDNKSVFMSAAGSDVAVTLNKMNINMPAGDTSKVRSQWGTCYIYLNVKIPQGYTIASNQTTLLGGLLKDGGVSGYVDIVTALNSRAYHSNVNWFRGVAAIGPVTQIFRNLKYREELNEPLFQMSKNASFNKMQKNRICRLTANQSIELGYYIQISMAATRNSFQKSAIFNIDSMDGNFNLASSAEACSK